MSNIPSPGDQIDPQLQPLVKFVAENRDKITEIYDIEHAERGDGNPDNQGNPGCLVVTRTPDNTVDIYYFPWIEMESKLQESVAAEKCNDKIIILVLLDKITLKSVMISVDRISPSPPENAVSEPSIANNINH